MAASTHLIKICLLLVGLHSLLRGAQCGSVIKAGEITNINARFAPSWTKNPSFNLKVTNSFAKDNLRDNKAIESGNRKSALLDKRGLEEDMADVFREGNKLFSHVKQFPTNKLMAAPMAISGFKAAKALIMMFYRYQKYDRKKRQVEADHPRLERTFDALADATEKAANEPDDRNMQRVVDRQAKAMDALKKTETECVKSLKEAQRYQEQREVDSLKSQLKDLGDVTGRMAKFRMKELEKTMSVIRTNLEKAGQAWRSLSEGRS